jgi:hypothetical protein
MAKKTVKCVSWLSHLLNETLPKARTRLAAGAAARFVSRRIKLVDGSIITQYGKKGETVRIHMCYDLTHGCMDETHVTDNRTAESFALFNISSGDIYITDAGFGKGKQLQYIAERQADAVLRVTPNHLSLAEDSKGKKEINMVKKLDTEKKVIDFTCFVHTEKNKYVPVRIIASRLPEDKLEKAIKRKKRTAQRKRSVLKDKTLIFAGWVILMTTLDESYSALEILNLYRARWQIELLFKRIKQFFKVVRLRKASIQHSKALVLLWLIIWSLTERDVAAAEIRLQEKQEDLSDFSIWTMSGFFLNRFKVLIHSLLLTCYEADDVLLNIYNRLKNHKSSRLNQYSFFHFGSVSFLVA